MVRSITQLDLKEGGGGGGREVCQAWAYKNIEQISDFCSLHKLIKKIITKQTLWCSGCVN